MDVGIIIGEATPLSWERWRHLVHLVERLGYHSLFRSDHYFNGKQKEAIDVYLSFVMAAEESERIRFGPLVTPVTFREPVNVGRMAQQLDSLSDGRFVMGLGAGWYPDEHQIYGLDFPPAARAVRPPRGGHRADEGAVVLELRHASPASTTASREPTPSPIRPTGRPPDPHRRDGPEADAAHRRRARPRVELDAAGRRRATARPTRPWSSTAPRWAATRRRSGGPCSSSPPSGPTGTRRTWRCDASST